MTMLLVISVDGLAPRAITPASMPNLCALARSGASCFTARTIEPPITVPAHASMFRGVPAETHQLVDNSRSDPAGTASSFLAAAGASGRSTASVLCWMPLDALIEADVVDHRVALAAGYDPDDDVTVTGHVVELLSRHRPDVTLTYLVATDLAGHAHGWDSPQYADAAGAVDARLGELFAAAGRDASIVVTTDHGGLDRNHFQPVPETMQTFVIVRSPAVAPGSTWTAASILDIAPTVADLAEFDADPAWVGTSLIGRERPLADHLLDLVASMAHHTYGELVDMLQHSLQTAALASKLSDELALAGLLHDIGHLLGEAGRWGLPDHATLGARYLQQWLPPGIVDPIRLHVDAKRYLVATDPGYLERLSPASLATLEQQGGPFDEAEVAAFADSPHADAAVALRRFDDAGKRDDITIANLESYRDLLAGALASGAVAATSRLTP
jgi:predicted HD phosphohydrolase